MTLKKTLGRCNHLMELLRTCPGVITLVCRWSYLAEIV